VSVAIGGRPGDPGSIGADFQADFSKTVADETTNSQSSTQTSLALLDPGEYAYITFTPQEDQFQGTISFDNGSWAQWSYKNTSDTTIQVPLGNSSVGGALGSYYVYYSPTLVPCNALTNTVKTASISSLGSLAPGSVTQSSTTTTTTTTPTTPKTPVNLALAGNASQSTTYQDGALSQLASNAINGTPNANDSDSGVAATNYEANPWWQVDLGAEDKLSTIDICNRTDCCQSRLTNYWVLTSASPFDTAEPPGQLAALPGNWGILETSEAGTPTHIVLPAGTTGRFVMVVLVGTGTLNLAQVEVYGTANSESSG
jgi:hypothetical protein